MAGNLFAVTSRTRSLCGPGTFHKYHVDRQSNQFCRKFRQSFGIVRSRAEFKDQIAVFDVSEPAHLLPECGEQRVRKCATLRQDTDPCLLIALFRMRRERPRGRRAAQKRDELPASHRSPPGSKPRTASSHSRPGLGTGQGGCELRPIVLGWECRFWVPRQVKRKSSESQMFSALPPKADIDRRDGYVRFVPIVLQKYF